MPSFDLSQLSTGLFWLMPENIARLVLWLLPGPWTALAGALAMLIVGFIFGVQRPALNNVPTQRGRVPDRVYVQVAWWSVAAGLVFLAISVLAFSGHIGVLACAVAQIVVGGVYVVAILRAFGEKDILRVLRA
jgi:hypothetical protein